MNEEIRFYEAIWAGRPALGPAQTCRYVMAGHGHEISGNLCWLPNGGRSGVP